MHTHTHTHTHTDTTVVVPIRPTCYFCPGHILTLHLTCAASVQGTSSTPVVQAALRLIAAVSAVPGSIVVHTQAAADRLLRLHYVSFTNAYAGQRRGDSPPLSTCRLHLEVRIKSKIISSW
jgi:hypothetical protein